MIQKAHSAPVDALPNTGNRRYVRMDMPYYLMAKDAGINIAPSELMTICHRENTDPPTPT